MSKLGPAIAVGVLCLAASAVAATPQHGDYVDHGNGNKVVIDLNVFPDLKAMQPNFFNKCAKVPVQYEAKIKPNGKFGFDGTAVDINGTRLTISIHGKFVSAKRATGTVDYDAPGCKGKPVDFDAKFDGVISK